MRELDHKELRWTCDLKNKIPKKQVSLEEVVLQKLFIDSFEMGVKIDGHHLYVADFNCADANQIIESLIRRFDKRKTFGDIIRAHDFDNPYVQKNIHVPKGHGRKLEKQLDGLKTKLFEAEEYITDQTNDLLSAEFAKIQQIAEKNGIKLEMDSPDDYTYKPLAPITSEEERVAFASKTTAFHQKYTMKFKNTILPAAFDGKEFSVFMRDNLQNLLDYEIEKLKMKYSNSNAVCEFLDAVASKLLTSQSKNGDHALQDSLSNLEINVLVDNSKIKRVPIIFEHSPSYFSLIGQYRTKNENITAEKELMPSKFFAGSLIKANGGYLVFDIEQLLKHPSCQLTYSTVMNALSTGKLKILRESETGANIDEMDINVKVILTGSFGLYHYLCEQDDSFKKLFKTRADFSQSIENTESSQKKYAAYLKQFSKENNLLPLDASGYEAVLEHAARITGRKSRLSTNVDSLTELLIETDVLAKKISKKSVGRSEIELGISENFNRKSINYSRTKSFIKNYSLLAFEGKEVGQINGLVVQDYGDICFGFPERITACVGVGDDGVIYPDIEAKLAGEILTKSAHIVDAYLTGKYCTDKPLHISARVTFEQSYSEIDGDSASSTTVYALLSALSKIPIRQNIAVTGSVDRFGNVMVIGGVNSKIAGFYDVCKENGFTGDQGVMIPSKNVADLMLRPDIIESVKNKEFHIYPVSTIDEGLEVLTCREAKLVHGLVNDEILRLCSEYGRFRK